jgi:hypothetical protein
MKTSNATAMARPASMHNSASRRSTELQASPFLLFAS